MPNVKWISISESLPNFTENVLVVQNPKTTATREPLFAWFDGSYFRSHESGNKWVDIIYWMRLPKPPKK